MEPIQHLIQYHDAAFDAGHFAPDSDCVAYVERLDGMHQRLLEQHNGFYAYDRALHLFGCSPDQPFHDFVHRNKDSDWRQWYGSDAEGLLFFAEDVLGNLYAYSSENIVFFDVETGETETVAYSFSEWLQYIATDTDYATGWSLARAWASQHAPLSFDMRLMPKQLFVMGGAFDVSNLRAVPWDQALRFRADVARQIRDLPDGTSIEIGEQE